MTEPNLRAAASGESNERQRSSAPRTGWRRLAHSCGVQISCLQPNSQAPDPSKTTSATTLLRPTVFVRAPWRFILFRRVRNS